MGSMQANTPPSSDYLFTPNRRHLLQPSSWAGIEPAELRPDNLDWDTRSHLQEVEKSWGWQASEELTYNKPINLLSIRLSFLDFNEIGWQWCLSNGMELSDMSGFIDRISYQDYDTCVHTSEPGHFFRLACGQKRVIESPPSRGSLFWFGGRGLFCPLFFFGNKKEQFQSPSLYPAFTPSFFFTIFLTHFAEKYIMKQHHSSLFSLSDGESGGTDCPE